MDATKGLLNVSNTQLYIEQFPTEKLTEDLKKLWIYGNNLKLLPKEIKICSNLQYLDLEANNLSTFPDELLALKQLERLDLSKNNIGAIPEKICELNKLKDLRLLGTNLKNIPRGLCKLENLERLCVSFNSITELPSCFEELKEMKQLNLSRNEFKEFPASVLLLHNLELLWLSFNKISFIPEGIENLSKLKRFWLNNNSIRELPESICHLKNLEDMRLKVNKLTSLPLKIGNLKKITKFDIDSNPLVQPPLEVAMRGLKDIKQYQDELAREAKVKLEEPRAKLVFLGKEYAGKSSLVHALAQGKAKLVQERTQGIQVRQCKWSLGERKLHLMVFDFGGNDIYHMSQQAFLSKDAIHLIVVDLKSYKESEFEEKVGCWLRMLDTRVPGAIACLVGTHLDQCDDNEVKMKSRSITQAVNSVQEKNRKYIQLQISELEKDLNSRSTLVQHSPVTVSADMTTNQRIEDRISHLQNILSMQTRFLNGVKVVTVSSASGLKNVNSLKKKIIVEAHELLGLRAEVPKSWCNLEKRLQDKPANEDLNDRVCLTLKECEREAELMGLKPQHLPAALRYLHRVGQLIHYEDSGNISNCVFHKPLKLINILKEIFHHDCRLIIDVEDNARFGGITISNRKQEKKNFLQRGLLSKTILSRLMNPHLKKIGSRRKSKQGERSIDEIRFIIELLIQFGVCYHVSEVPATLGPDKDYYCFPLYLQDSAPENRMKSDWPKVFDAEENQVQLLYEFCSCCPPGLFERLSALIYPKFPQRCDWKSGMLARSRGVRLLVIRKDVRIKSKDGNGQNSDGNSSQITISCRGSWHQTKIMWDCVKEVQKELNELIIQWPGLLYSFHMTCPDCIKQEKVTPHLFPGRLLRDSSLHPEDTTILCDECNSEVDTRLLNYPKAYSDSKSISQVQASIPQVNIYQQVGDGNTMNI